MPITILDYVKSVVGDKDLYTAEDCLASGVDILGGCQGCHATIAVYNAYPSTSGYWRCADCIGDDGYATVADFTASDPARDLPVLRQHRQPSAKPASPPASAPRNTCWNAVTAARSGSHEHRSRSCLARRHLRRPPPQGRRPRFPHRPDVHAQKRHGLRARRCASAPATTTTPEVVAMTTTTGRLLRAARRHPDATPAQIKKAYRKLARQHHPDTNPGDQQAAARFRQITEAYDTLSDPGRRDAYDRAHGPFTGTRLATPSHGNRAASLLIQVLEDTWLAIRAPPPRNPGRGHHLGQRHRNPPAPLGPPRLRPLERRQRPARRSHDQRRSPPPHPARGPGRHLARGRPRPGPRPRHQGHLPPGPLPQQALQDPRRAARPGRRARPAPRLVRHHDHRRHRDRLRATSSPRSPRP